jgi:hypothetical protein
MVNKNRKTYWLNNKGFLAEYDKISSTLSMLV